METIADIPTLVACLKPHFDLLQDRFISFAHQGVQTEGWLKGELLTALDSWTAERRIPGFDREAKTPSRNKVDLLVDLPSGKNWVELKHWLIGKQKGTNWSSHSYFGDRSSVGVLPDVKKLCLLPPGDLRWVLVLLTRNPGACEWRSGIAHFNRMFAPQRLHEANDIDGFPPTYALGLLAVFTL